MNDHSINIGQSDFLYKTLSAEGKTPIFLSDDKTVLGMIAVADVIKPGSKDAVRKLQSMGLDVYMLTGDNAVTAAAVQQEVGIKQILAEVLPQDKDNQIALLQKTGKIVAMVGDGINDAPALARADVGIAIGAGSDIALDSADVVLMNNDLLDVVTTLRLSKAVIGNIKQNLFWAFFYNILGIPLAAGLFYELSGWTLSPMVAAAAMSFSSVTVVLNALRLRGFKPTINNSSKNNSIMNKKIIHIEGMSCGHCSATVEKALNGIEGVKASVSLSDKIANVSIEGSVSDEKLKKAVEDAGYEVTGIE
jgi:Cu+-exporting ATPase